MKSALWREVVVKKRLPGHGNKYALARPCLQTLAQLRQVGHEVMWRGKAVRLSTIQAHVLDYLICRSPDWSDWRSIYRNCWPNPTFKPGLAALVADVMSKLRQRLPDLLESGREVNKTNGQGWRIKSEHLAGRRLLDPAPAQENTAGPIYWRRGTRVRWPSC